MPQLVVAALIGAGLYAGYRWISHIAAEPERSAQLATQRAHARDGRPPIKDLGTLELDPRSGVYRPSRRDA